MVALGKRRDGMHRGLLKGERMWDGEGLIPRKELCVHGIQTVSELC